MAKPAVAVQPASQNIPITIEAVATFRTIEGNGQLCEAISLTIVDGVVVAVTRLNRGPDLPAMAVGAAQHVLWSTLRTNKYEGQ